jgi:two-component system, sensor histidine kinase and response regulator
MRILLADDQQDVCLLTQRQLEKRGHTVLAVCNGQDALRALQQQTFDAVVLDEEMPGMNGTEVVRKIRARENQSGHIVVVAVTGYNSEPDKERLLSAGFDAVLGKPFRMEVLEATLRSAASEGASGMADTRSSATQDPPADLLSRVGGDAQLLAQMARTFLEDLPERLVKLQKSIRQKNGEALAFDAHALKGSLSIFAADRAAQLCKQLQEHAKTARYPEAAHTFAALKEAIAELERNLRGYAEQKRATAPVMLATSKTRRRTPESK